MADGDLISRASLLAGIAELKESPWYNFGKVDGTSPEGVEAIWHYGYLQRKEAIAVIIEQCIEKETAVEAEPVKHGRWEINCDGYYPYCSNCKNEPQGREMTAYCPNCGAKMDIIYQDDKIKAVKVVGWESEDNETN